MNKAYFSLGEIVRHKLFGYYGVIYDVDPIFMGSEEWYAKMARSKPPKNAPWYRILVDGQNIETYVAERNLDISDEFRKISHPLLDTYFDGYDNNRYKLITPMD